MTKLFSLALVAALAASATSAATVDVRRYLSDGEQDGRTYVKLGTITADAAGTIEIYDYRGGTQGALLATDTFEAGTTPAVRVPVGGVRRNAILAVFSVDGVVAHQEVIGYLGGN